jgi:thiamine biosynthesis protein ThiC
MGRMYSTQMEAARKGIITPEMEIVAAKEQRTTEEIRHVCGGRESSHTGKCPS